MALNSAHYTRGGGEVFKYPFYALPLCLTEIAQQEASGVQANWVALDALTLYLGTKDTDNSILMLI